MSKKEVENELAFILYEQLVSETTVVVDDVVVTTESFRGKRFILYVPSPAAEELRAVHEYSYCMTVAQFRRVRSRVL